MLEARDRVGGRVWSAPFAGAVVERGAEFVLPGNEHVERLAAAARAAPVPEGHALRRPRAARRGAHHACGGTRGARRGRRRRHADGHGRERPGRARARPRGGGGDPRPHRGLERRAGRGARRVGPLAARLRRLPDVGCRGRQRPAGRGPGRRGSTCAGRRPCGASRGRPTACGSTTWRPTRACSRSRAPAVADLAFAPALPERTAHAVAAVRTGRAAKLALALAEPAPPSAVLAVPERFWSYTGLAPDGAPLAVAGTFAGTAAALERLEVEAGATAWTARVHALRPDLSVRRPHAAHDLARRPVGPRRVLAGNGRRRARRPGAARAGRPASRSPASTRPGTGTA